MGRTDDEIWAELEEIRLAIVKRSKELDARELPIHRTEAGYPHCATCDGGGCFDCTDSTEGI